MADRSVAAGDTLNKLRFEFNGTAEDIGDIQSILDASGFIASSTDVVEAIVAINTELPEIKQDSFVFPTGTMTFEGATDDSFETVLSMTDATADRTYTFPDADGTTVLADSTDTSTNKTFTSATITSGVFNTGVSGTAVKDEDNMASDSATALATQQSIKAYVDNEIDSEMDLVFTTDSGSGQITMDSETLTLAGGTGVDSSATSNTATFAIDSTVTTLTGSQTLTNKTLTTPTITSGVFNTGVSGSAVLDEDDLSSDSATKLATQQSIKAYVDNTLAAQDLDFAPDSGTGQNIVLETETMTIAGGTAIGTSATSNTVTLAIDSTVTTLTGSQTLTNKTFTSPTINTLTFASGTTTSGLNIGGSGIIFEGATADAHETTLVAAEPTADATITIPNSTMTLLTTATHANKSNHISRCIALG